MRRELIREIVKKHYYLQYGCFFSDIIKVGDGVFTYNDVMDCFIWNHYFTNDMRLLENTIDFVDAFFASRRRNPCIYVDDCHHTEDVQMLLHQHGYEKKDNEAWLMYKGRYNDRNRNLPLLKATRVDSEELLNRFLTICGECFESEYSIAIAREFSRYQVHKMVSHYVFTNTENEPVAIASVYTDGNCFFVHNVGVPFVHRKKGYATSLLRMLIDEIFSQNQFPSIFLQSDGGGYIEEFYKNNGFELIYRRWGYVNESIR